jgi:hypothetical protein
MSARDNFLSREYSETYYRNVSASRIRRQLLSSPITDKTGISQRMLAGLTNMTFHKNPFSSSGVTGRGRSEKQKQTKQIPWL